jgi:hypothetical protein
VVVAAEGFASPAAAAPQQLPVRAGGAADCLELFAALAHTQAALQAGEALTGCGQRSENAAVGGIGLLKTEEGRCDEHSSRFSPSSPWLRSRR